MFIGLYTPFIIDTPTKPPPLLLGLFGLPVELAPVTAPKHLAVQRQGPPAREAAAKDLSGTRVEAWLKMTSENRGSLPKIWI